MKHSYLWLLALLLSLSSCSSFEKYRGLYHDMLGQADLEGASRLIEKKKFYKKDRNQVLYYLELGALARLQGDLQQSNEHLNQADLLIEDRRASVGAQGLAVVSNPRVLPYQTEYFENVAVHYQKSLNYLQLNNLEAARVEARRMNIRLQALNDAVPDKPLKYRDDVLGHLMMGLSYEMNGEWNNAFIAYRNAANLFLQDGKLGPYMGTPMPEQLKCDLIRMAEANGFQGEAERYRKALKPRCREQEGEGGSLVLFWENGQGPIKEEQIIGFNIFRQGNAHQVRFVNQKSGLEYDYGQEVYDEFNGFAGLSNISVALPYFQRRNTPLQWAQVKYHGGLSKMELVEDFNVIAEQSLRDRFVRELGSALLRLAAKKAVEAGLRTIKTKKQDDEEADGKDGAEKKKSEEKEEEYDETLGIVLSGAMSIVNAATERADIRSWQSLPAQIHYQRIPLKKGFNNISVTFFNQYNQRMEEVNLRPNGNGRLQVSSLATPGLHALSPSAHPTTKPIQP